MAFRAPNFVRRWTTLAGSDVDWGHSQPIITFCSNSLIKPVTMTQHVSIKSHFFNQKPHGICNFEEQFVFPLDSIWESFDIRNVPHTSKSQYHIATTLHFPWPHTNISYKSSLDSCQHADFAEIVENVAGCFVSISMLCSWAYILTPATRFL